MNRNELVHLIAEYEKQEAEFKAWLKYQEELWLQEFPI